VHVHLEPVVADHILQVGGHKNKVDATESQLSDHQEHIGQEPYEAGKLANCEWASGEGMFTHLGEA